MGISSRRGAHSSSARRPLGFFLGPALLGFALPTSAAAVEGLKEVEEEGEGGKEGL